MNIGNTTQYEDQLAEAKKLAREYMSAQPPRQAHHHKVSGIVMLSFVTDFTMPYELKVHLIRRHVEYGVRNIRTLRALFHEAEQEYRRATYSPTGRQEPEVANVMAALARRKAMQADTLRG